MCGEGCADIFFGLFTLYIIPQTLSMLHRRLVAQRRLYSPVAVPDKVVVDRLHELFQALFALPRLAFFAIAIGYCINGGK